MRVFKLVASVSLAFLVFGGASVWADDEDDNNRRGGEGEKLFSAQLLRIADLSVPAGNAAGQQLGPLFGPNGDDPLGEGSVDVRAEGRTDISVRGGSPSKSYTVFFCRFAFGPAGCVMVGAAGALTTDSGGNGTARLDFPQPLTGPDSWAGVFILTRPVSNQPTNEYVSGFHLRLAPMVNENQAEIEIQGQVTSVNMGNGSFRIGSFPQDIMTDNATQFRDGLQKFSDVKMGIQVEVKAKVSNGNLLALEVQGKGGPELSRGRGRGHD
jgi:hypothetical protein